MPQNKRKVHLACGANLLAGWENYDLRPSTPDVRFINLLHTFPFDNNSVDFIFFEHAVEHFDEVDGYKIMQEIHRVLKPGGKYVSIGGISGKLLQMLYMRPVLRLFTKKRVHMVMLKANKDLDYINLLFQENKLDCIIDGPYGFEELPWAIQRFGDGLHHGKIVISLT
jgi:predicted SAM-dependent methyltransferase